MSMVLPPALVAPANRYVHTSPPDRNPRFKRIPGLTEVRGAILRYSTTTPAR